MEKQLELKNEDKNLNESSIANIVITRERKVKQSQNTLVDNGDVILL